MTQSADTPSLKTALLAGVLYLLTFVSIPTLSICAPVKSAGYILGSGPDMLVFKGFKTSKKLIQL